VAHEKPARHLVDQRGSRSRTLYRKLNKRKCKKYLLVRESAENDLLVRQCTKVHCRTCTRRPPTDIKREMAFEYLTRINDFLSIEHSTDHVLA